MRLCLVTLLPLFAALPLPALAQDKDGAEVFAAVCRECHGSGKDNAPTFGDRKRWGKLVREGLDDLVPAALRGVDQDVPAGRPDRRVVLHRYRCGPVVRHRQPVPGQLAAIAAK